MKLAKLVKHFRIGDPRKFSLAKWDPSDTCGLNIEKDDAKAFLAQGIERLSELQERLYAQDRWAVLVIFQGMDTAGKDSAIKHVMSGINPQGCDVRSFKRPSDEEKDHDFLWRSSVRLPERGRIGIFNRSYYEEVLIVRVHKNGLEGEKLPASLMHKAVWKNRFKDIRAYERYLTRNGTLVLKFYLHLSKDEQRRRFLERLDNPSKNWKFSFADLAERRRWDDYMVAYEDMIANTSTSKAPWYVVPADNKWFTRMVVVATIVVALENIDLSFPKPRGKARNELAKARKMLTQEG
jgi:PPK2 family polyphosphate:nucleotide phosphotransferase